MKKNNQHHIEGRLSGARSGAGFVKDPSQDMDVMVPQRDLNSALPGDRVRVRINRTMPGESRLSGVVTAVLERAKRDIVGTLQRYGKRFVVIPLSPTYKQTFFISDPKDATVGERVVIRFSEWERTDRDPEGEIVDIIGPADNPSLDTEAVMRQFNLPERFPTIVTNEAENVSSLLEQPAERTDLRDKLIITIDPETARDFDDAISLDHDKDGNRVLGVHIADVSHFVRLGSPLDREARKRGTSVYLVDKVIPMLPEQLSNGVCSLRPDEDRLCLSAFLTFNASGVMVRRQFCRSHIRSKLRLFYEEAMDVIADRPVHTGKDISPEARTLILESHQLAQQLRALRFKRSALDLAVPETQIIMTPDGRMTGVQAATHDVSHELIEECMIAANEAVSVELSGRHIPHLSRFHDAPAPEKLEELAGNLLTLGISVVGDLTNPKNLANLLRSVENHPLRYYIDMLILRSMKRAEYSADDSGHFGLAKRFYSHFTSPIRRYPDLVLHRQLAAMLAGDKNGQPSLNYLRDVANTSTETEFNAEQASRELIEIKKYRFLQQQLDDGKPLEYEAVIVKVTDFGVFVEIIDLGISGLIHVSAFGDGRAYYDGGAQTLRIGKNTYGIGEKLQVFVAAVNFDQRKVDFGVVNDKGERREAKPLTQRTQRFNTETQRKIQKPRKFFNKELRKHTEKKNFKKRKR